MRATRVLEAATYLALGSMVAILLTLCLFELSLVRDVETRVAETCSPSADIAPGTLDDTATFPAKSQSVRTWAATADFSVPSAHLLAQHPVVASRAALYGENIEREFEQPQGVRRADLAMNAAAGYGLAAVQAARGDTSSTGSALQVWADAPLLLREAVREEFRSGRLDGSARPAAFHRLRESVLLVGVAAVVSGLLLVGLISRSLVAEKARTRDVVRAKANLETSTRERSAELQQAITSLRQHVTHVDAAIEEERVRIAHDIHDDLGSILTALKIELSGGAGDGTRAGERPRARRASTDLVDAAMQSVRGLIAALQPYPLQRAGLWGALAWKADEVEKLLGIPCCLVMDPDLPRPPTKIATAAFRIVEEALTNVARHARATAAEVVVQFAAGQLVIEITDDGRGVRAGKAAGQTVSYGLTGMRERAEAVGGSLTVAGCAGRGTTVRFSVPIDVPGPRSILNVGTA